MDWYSILAASGVMMGLGIVLSAILAIANKKFYVDEDPRIDEVEGMLPGANCGACGEPGCRAFAEAVVGGKSSPSGCSVSSEEGLQSIAAFLGIEVGSADRKVARLACAGGSNVARTRAEYEGLQSCRGADLVTGGGKGCAWGCLGYADCQDVCSFDAMTMSEYHLPVVDVDKCTACGDCVDICPRDLFSLQPLSYHLWVACKNEIAGDGAELECEVACTACGRCVMDAPAGLINLKNNFAVVDYSFNSRMKQDYSNRCPTGAIGWFADKKAFVKGKAAKKIVRKGSLPVG